jgi:hypothetical protein
MIWFGLLGGGVAWVIHLLAAYVLSEWGCVRHAFPGFSLLGLSGLAWLLLGVTALTLLVAAAGALAAYSDMRGKDTVGEEERDPMALDDSRARIAQIGCVMSLTFLLVILAESVPIFFYLQGC